VSQFNLYNISAQAGEWVARSNGVPLMINTANTVSFNSGPMLGANGTYAFDGQVAEIIIYNSFLTPEQRTTVTLYLQSKYNIFGDPNLDANLDDIPDYIDLRIGINPSLPIGNQLPATPTPTPTPTPPPNDPTPPVVTLITPPEATLN